MKLLIFDLDGTLLNTIEDLAACANHVLHEHGMPVHTVQEITTMVGRGMRNLMKSAVPPEVSANNQAVDSILREFLDWYQDHLDIYTRPYPGMVGLVSSLHEKGYAVAVASNKIQAGTEKLISKFFPGIPFAAVLGNSPRFPLKPSADVVNFIMEKAGSSKADTIMVGDSGIDIQTARNAGIPVIAVSWGFRPRHELTEADYIADTADDIFEKICNKSNTIV